jgi:hypothetical protein
MVQALVAMLAALVALALGAQYLQAKALRMAVGQLKHVVRTVVAHAAMAVRLSVAQPAKVVRMGVVQLTQVVKMGVAWTTMAVRMAVGQMAQTAKAVDEDASADAWTAEWCNEKQEMQGMAKGGTSRSHRGRPPCGRSDRQSVQCTASALGSGETLEGLVEHPQEEMPRRLPAARTSQPPAGHTICRARPQCVYLCPL